MPPSAGAPASDDDHASAAWAALRELSSLDLEALEVHAPQPAGDRPALLDVGTDEGHASRRVVVTLRHRGQRVETAEQATDTAHGAERAAARATVAALRALLPPSVAELHLDWIDVLEGPTPNRPHVVHCAIALRTASGEDLLVGSAVVRDGARADAAARAVLDAVNRRFIELTGG